MKRVAISAHSGRDGKVLLRILTVGGISRILVEPATLLSGVAEAQYVSALITEEVALQISVDDVELGVASQPWRSDLSVIVLTSPGSTDLELGSLLAAFANVIQVERPVHPSTLGDLIKPAKRTHDWQGAAPHYLGERERAEQTLRRIVKDLEQQVAERKRDLALMTDQLALEIEKRTKAQNVVERTRRELNHSARVSAVDNMASTIAHEVNQPLTAVMNYIRGSKRLLEANSIPISPAIFDALDSAAENARRAADIILNLRAIVSQHDILHEEVNLPQLVREALDLGMIHATPEASSIL